MTTQTIVALSYTKLRTAFGLVGIEVDSQNKIAYVRLAKIWKRDDMNVIAPQLKDINKKIKWDMTFADQLIGQHLIRKIESALQFEVQTITTMKNLKDPEDIELIKVMDMTEMTQLTLSLKQEHKIQFPKKNHTKDMLDLMKQIEMFTEHTTESGTVAYYAPGEEKDCLTKALMICLFAARISLQQGNSDPIIMQGTKSTQTPEESFDNYFESVLGDDYNDGLSPISTGRASRSRIFDRASRDWR